MLLYVIYTDEQRGENVLEEIENNNILFNKIYDESYLLVLKYISSRCKSSDDVADIMQETYLELFKVISNKNDYIKNTTAFVLSIAKRKLFRHYTLIEKFKMLVPLYKNDDELDPIDEIGGFEFEDELITEMVLNDIWNIILESEETTKQIFIMRYSEDLSLEEIAKKLGLPIHTVRNKLYRTIEQIKSMYNKQGD